MSTPSKNEPSTVDDVGCGGGEWDGERGERGREETRGDEKREARSEEVSRVSSGGARGAGRGRCESEVRSLKRGPNV